MRLNRTLLSGGVALAALAATFIGTAQAALTFDQNAPKGVYFGSGNPDGGWTLATSSNDEFVIGLRAKTYKGAVLPDPTPGTYQAVTGLANPTHATWNWEFLVENVQDTGLAGLTATLVITSAAGLTNSPGGDILAIGDNAIRNPIGGTADSGEQNSENMLFPFLPGYNPWYGDSYNFTVTLKNGAGDILATDSITVNAVPEPASMTLFALGLAGLGAVRRRRR